MPPKIIKLTKKDDITSAVKYIKSSREREILFELEKGSPLLRNSDNMKLMKRTGDVVGKKILISTNDEIGKVLAKKAGVLAGGLDANMPKGPSRVARSDIKPKFSDIKNPSKIMERVKSVGLPSIAPKSLSMPSIPNIPKVDFKLEKKSSKLFISILSGVVIAFIALAILLPQATVTVFARSEPISRDFEINVDKNANKSDSDKLLVSGIPVSQEVSLTKSFPTSGNNPIGTKSAGSVVLYNFTSNTLTLKAATTTLVANGNKYFFTKDVTGIKPTGGTEANPNSSTLIPAVSIIAEQAGEKYNLPANTKFQVVNAALGNRNVYAINPTALNGGLARPSTVLSQQDFDNAVASLTNDIIAQAETDLSDERGTPIKLIPSGVGKEILAQTANKKVGEEAANFDMTLIAKVTGLAFSENTIIDLVETKINEVLSSDKYLVDSDKKNYQAVYKSIDIPNGVGVLSVHFETIAAYKVDNTNIAKLLAGKTASEIKEILLSKPEVDNVKVDFWPSWLVHKAPKWNGKVYIKTELSQ